MASEQQGGDEPSLPREEAVCPGCQGSGPLVLPCGHSLCEACLGLCEGELGQGGCTICYGKDLLDCVLKRLLDSLFQGQPRRARDGGVEDGDREMCPLHGERLTLYCVEDKEMVCVECQSEEHDDHECRPTEEAVHDCKRELTSALRPLQEKLEALNTVKQTCGESAEHIKSQAQQTERLVQQQFEKLHQFLRDEEAAVISALKEEEQEKTQRMRDRIDRTTDQINSLAEAIEVTVEAMDTGDDISFLKNFKRTSERTQVTVQEPEEVAGALLDVAKHLGCLNYRVWEKMQDVITYTPVTLDPNTADTCLSLSDDLTSLRYTEEEERLPDNPERFCYYECVLGSEGFNSGRHTWDVEVGVNSEWAVGVARETVSRKEWFPPSPERGLWTICYYGGEYRARTASATPLVLKRRPLEVRVQLDWDRGRVIFSDASDNTLIYKFQHKFTQRVFPYFSNTCKRHPLRISAGKVSVTAE
ncbi:zinc-binding protein A33 [Salvelinus alpinus]